MVIEDILSDSETDNDDDYLSEADTVFGSIGYEVVRTPYISLCQFYIQMLDRDLP